MQLHITPLSMFHACRFVTTNIALPRFFSEDKMRQTLRIAVLECDTPLPGALKRYAGYGGVFRELLNSGAKALAEKNGKEPVALDITKWDVVNEERYPELDDVDGVLLTGSSECLRPFRISTPRE